MKRLLIASALSVLLSTCSLGTGLDVRAYDNCLARHREDAVVCEGPRQAYELDPSIVQARSAGVGPATGYRYEEGGDSSTPRLAPVPLRPGPMTGTSGPNG